MEFLKRTWYIWVLLGVAIYLLTSYGWLSFLGINGKSCSNPHIPGEEPSAYNPNPNPGMQPGGVGNYKNGTCWK